MSLQSILDDVDENLEWTAEVDSARISDILNFSASTSQVSFGDILDPGAGDSFTVEILAQTLDTVSNMFLFSKKSGGGAAAAGWGVSLGASLFVIRAADGVTEVTASVSGVPYIDGQQRRITFVVDRVAQVMRLYVSGVLVLTSGSISAVGSLASSQLLLIGNRGSGVQPWIGSLEDFRYWTVARTQAQIASTLLPGQVATTASGIAILAPMTEEVGTKVFDRTVNARHGTITGATWGEMTRTWYYSTHPRLHGSSATPANTEFRPYLLSGSIGPLVQSLTEDTLFADHAKLEPGTLRVVQPTPTPSTDRLSDLRNYSFSGRQVRIKVGYEGDDYANFQLYRTIICEQNPNVVLTDDGLEASWKLASPLSRMLAEHLSLPRYLGIPHCLKLLTSTGSVSIPKVAAHDASRFVASIVFRMASNPAAPRLLFGKILSVSDSHFRLRVGTTGLIDVISSSGGVTDINHTTPAGISYADGQFHKVAFARDNDQYAYLKIDDKVILTFTPTGNTDLSNTTLVIGSSGGGDDIEVLSARLYGRYIPPEELDGILALPAQSGDIDLVGSWPFTDNGGAAVNDEGSGNSDGVINGTINVDYSWGPSDLGEPELAGRPYPFAIGDLFNARAHLIDSVRERYRLSSEDPNITGTVAVTVRSQGTQLTGGGTDYTLSDSDRLVQMTAQEGEPVTFDYRQSSVPAAAFPAQLAHDALVARTRITDSMISSRYSAMSVLAPWKVGYYTDQEITAAQLLKSLLGDAGMYYTDSPAGELYMDMLLPSVGYGPFNEPAFDFNGGIGAEVYFDSVGTVAAAGSLTLCGWIKTPMVDGGAVGGTGSIALVAHPNSLGMGAGEYALWFQNRSGQYTQLRFAIDGNGTLDSPTNPLLPFTWYFVAGVFNDTANTMTLYLAPKGGQLVQIATQAAASVRGTLAGSMFVGSRLSDDAAGWGALQHSQVYSVAKSLSDLRSIMADPTSSPTGLERYIPMTEGIDLPIETVGDVEGQVQGLASFTHRWAPKLEVNLNTNPEITITDLRRVTPAAKLTVKFARNHLVMPSSDIDTGVSQSTRLSLMREGKSADYNDSRRASRHRTFRRVIYDSPLSEQAGAYRLLRTAAYLFGPGYVGGRLNFPAGSPLSRRALGLSIGEELGIIVDIPRFIYGKRSLRVAAVAPSPLSLSTVVSVYG